ncbi:MAG: hypothetical protein HFJ17_01185 [Clostridia bacterium]|nr:hypothetical protein [Clostridia bacterium]
MPFIGIIAKECDSNFIKNEVLKNSDNSKFEWFNISQENVENIKNITFETIIINEDISDILSNSKYLEDILKRAKYLIVNSDIVKNVYIQTDNIITYGLNSKATITISSVKDEDILICIQKSYKDIKGNDIEEQEINIKIIKNNLKKLCNSLSIFAVLSIYGNFLKKI